LDPENRLVVVVVFVLGVDGRIGVAVSSVSILLTARSNPPANDAIATIVVGPTDSNVHTSSSKSTRIPTIVFFKYLFEWWCFCVSSSSISKSNSSSECTTTTTKYTK
jgi:hypothetical protein